MLTRLSAETENRMVYFTLQLSQQLGKAFRLEENSIFYVVLTLLTTFHLKDVTPVYRSWLPLYVSEYFKRQKWNGLLLGIILKPTSSLKFRGPPQIYIRTTMMNEVFISDSAVILYSTSFLPAHAENQAEPLLYWWYEYLKKPSPENPYFEWDLVFRLFSLWPIHMNRAS